MNLSESKCNNMWTCMECSRCQNLAGPLPMRRWPRSVCEQRSNKITMITNNKAFRLFFPPSFSDKWILLYSRPLYNEPVKLSGCKNFMMSWKETDSPQQITRNQIPLWGWRVDRLCPPLPEAELLQGSAWQSSQSHWGPAGSIFPRTEIW